MSGLSPAIEKQICSAIADAAARGVAVVSGPETRVPLRRTQENRQVWRPDLSALTAVLEHEVADQVIHVQTGMPVRRLQTYLRKHGQFLPVRVPERWTLLDLINTGMAGPLEHGFGGVRELVLGLVSCTANGTAITSGGRVVKNVTGYDVTRLLVGSHGWLAVPLSVHLRLYALPETASTLVWSSGSLSRLFSAAHKLMRSGLPLACLELAQNDRLGLGTGSYLLFAQVMSSPAVCAELTAAAQNIVGQCDELVAGSDQEELWDYFTSLFMAISDATVALHVVAAPTVLPDLLPRLPHGSRWQVRPARGLATVVCPDVTEAVAELTRFSRQTGHAIVAAAADESYNYRLHYLPADEPARHFLKQRIKQEMDPRGALNPFVLV